MSGGDDRLAVTAEEFWPADADADEGVVVNWFVREGAAVEAGDTLCELQVEKVSFDVDAPADGTLAAVLVAEDDEFERTTVLAYLEPA